jgi:hypothetical protein
MATKFLYSIHLYRPYIAVVSYALLDQASLHLTFITSYVGLAVYLVGYFCSPIFLTERLFLRFIILRDRPV